MAVFRGDIRSSVLAMDTGLHVILPYDRPAQPQQEPCKAVYLLHGLGDNASAWCRYTRIEAYAREKGVAVIMPEGQRSFYCDMRHGLRYLTYLVEELPELCGKLFRISARREDTFVAGLSMGGYGALKCALTRPELYGGCAGFSGCLDIALARDEHIEEGEMIEELRAIMGMELQIPDGDNLFLLAERLRRRPREEWPALLLTCGTEDFLYDNNTGFRKHLDSLSIPYTYREWKAGHEWPFWDESIRMALDFFLPTEMDGGS